MLSRTVFVVSSSADDRSSTCDVVASLGYEPEPLEGTEQCLDALEKHTPLAVLVDLWMKPTRGDDCCRMIKESFGSRSIPVIITTTSDQPHEVMYCWRAAAEDFLKFPVDAHLLGPKLAALSRASQEQQHANPSPWASVLLADPSRFFRRVLGENLEHAGVQVLYAVDGEEALDLAREHAKTLDACLLDLGLTGMDGLRLAEALRATPSLRDKPLVLFTSSASPLPDEVVARIRRLTGSEPIEKRELPFDLILSRVHRALRREITHLRASERMPFFSLVEFSVDKRHWSTGFSYDVSAGGLFIRTLNPVPVGAPIELRVRFPGYEHASTSTGIVAWANPYRPRSTFMAPLGMGIHLTEMAPQFRQQISQLVKRAPATELRGEI